MTQKNSICFKFLVVGLLIGYANQAYATEPTPTKEIHYLSGKDNENTVPWDFYCTGGRNSGYWTKIQVPSHWEQQGFGRYDYGRDYRTYGKKFKFADEKGMYKHTFQVPENWRNKVIRIVFEGAMTDTEVMINGKPAGEMHQGAFYRFTYDISDKLDYGKTNLMEVTVHKMSADASVNNAERYADYWIFGGIFRPVYLEVYPTEFIEHTAIVAHANGSFAIDVHPKNLSGEKDIKAEIVDTQGKIVGSAIGKAKKDDSKVTLKTTIRNPKLWTSETPNLYKVNVSLSSGKEISYQLTERFGFRTIQIKRGDGIYINGTKVKMKGTNRHCFWPETGRSLNPAIDLMDIQLIKEMNMNAVRCSHYPPDKSFLNLCDSLGLYVLNELAGWQNAYNTNVGEKLVKELVLRDVNHPCIIFWSNGNEGGTNKELDDDYHLYDPSKRPVIHAHHRPGNAFNGIDTNHYENYYSTEKILQDSLIFMPTEFLHGQDDGGAAAALADYWELMWASKRSGGGFLWALLDEGIVRTDLNGYIDVNRLNAPDGVVGPHREKEGSFYAIKEIWSPVVIRMKELPSSFTGDIEIENRYHFTNLNQCTFTWKLIHFRKPTDMQWGHEVMIEESFQGPPVSPVSKGKLKLSLPSDWRKYDGLRLTALDPFKKEILTWTWKTNDQSLLVNKLVPLESSSPVEAQENDSTLVVKANGISVTFNKKDGMLSKLRNENGLDLLFGNGPVLCNGTASLTALKHQKVNDGHVIEMSYTGNLRYARWKMHGNGWLSLEYEYSSNEPSYFTGISFNLPESNVISARWLGNGPYRVWKNRMQGVTYDVWMNMYNNTQTGFYPWQYPEFKGYFSDVMWLELSTTEGKFLIASKEKDLFVRLFDFTGISGPNIFYPKLPPGNISFLDGIPPIGTKLATGISGANQLGPSSKLNELKAPIKRTLYFYFGYPE